jgi:hypothetical protein
MQVRTAIGSWPATECSPMVSREENPLGERQAHQSAEEREEELRKLRRLQMMVGMVLSVLRQDANLTQQQAQAMVDNCRTAALAMFPGKELAFDMIYKPRLARVMKERFRAL